MLNKLLVRQINRFIAGKEVINDNWNQLLEAVSHSYYHYEQDHILTKKSLEISSLEHRQNTFDLEERNEKIKAILEAASDGIFVANEANKIELCNSVAKTILNIDTDNIQNFDLSSIRIRISHKWEEIEAYELPFSEFLASPTKIDLYELFILQKNRPLPVEVSISEIMTTSGKLTICILRDISLRKELEEKINVRTDITHLLYESQTLNEAIPLLLSKIAILFEWDIGTFWVYDFKINKYVLEHIYSNKDTIHTDAVLEIKKNMLLKPQDLLSEEPFLTNNLLDEPSEFLNRLGSFHISTYMKIPVSFEKKNLSVIEFMSFKRKEKDEQLLHIIANIGTEVGIFIDRQQAITRELDLQKQLTEAAREAGKMQIATSVLHNVGNALNTLSTTISILYHNFQVSEMNNLTKISQLLTDHSGNLADFFTQDPKGKHLPDYIISLTNWWLEERERTSGEFNKLNQNIEYIRRIIASQQRISCVGSLLEFISINNVLDDIANLKSRECKKNQITIKKEYDDLPPIELDKGKFLQIILNLFSNAIDAVNQSSPELKQITLKTKSCPDKKICVHVRDNGVGIAKEHLDKIFSYGFTTKKEGHGFGLHSSFILAEEMHGNLKINNLGLGKGVEFILTLPMQCSS